MIQVVLVKGSGDARVTEGRQDMVTAVNTELWGSSACDGKRLAARAEFHPYLIAQVFPAMHFDNCRLQCLRVDHSYMTETTFCMYICIRTCVTISYCILDGAGLFRCLDSGLVG